VLLTTFPTDVFPSPANPFRVILCIHAQSHLLVGSRGMPRFVHPESCLAICTTSESSSLWFVHLGLCRYVCMAACMRRCCRCIQYVRAIGPMSSHLHHVSCPCVSTPSAFCLDATNDKQRITSLRAVYRNILANATRVAGKSRVISPPPPQGFFFA
jgi:hypothetical protein